MIDRNTQASLNNNDFVSTFEKATKDMVASNRKAYGGEWAGRFRTRPLKDYTREEVDKIINSGSLLAQQRLSRNYFEKDGEIDYEKISNKVYNDLVSGALKGVTFDRWKK